MLPTIAANVRAFCRVSASTSSASRLIHRPDLGAQTSSRDPLRVSTRRTTTSAEFVCQRDRFADRAVQQVSQLLVHRNTARFCIRNTDSSTRMVRRASFQ